MCKEFYNNDNFRLLVYVALFCSIGFMPIEFLGNIYLIENGLSDVIVADIVSILIPVKILAAIITGYVVSKHYTFIFYYFILALRIIDDIYIYLLVEYSFQPNYD